jgi:predicted  nucleic acid-binding Zn-ribbon protein
MAIREAKCLTCGYHFNETQSEWDVAWTTGRCPKCKKFLDHAREAEAVSRSREATTSSRAAAERRKRILTALGLVAPGILLYALGIPFRVFGVILMSSGVALLVRTLFHTTSEQAHQELERETRVTTQ